MKRVRAKKHSAQYRIGSQSNLTITESDSSVAVALPVRDNTDSGGTAHPFRQVMLEESE